MKIELPGKNCLTCTKLTCVVRSSSIYGFWLLLWYLQTLLNIFSGIFNESQRMNKQKSNYEVKTVWPVQSDQSVSSRVN